MTITLDRSVEGHGNDWDPPGDGAAGMERMDCTAGGISIGSSCGQHEQTALMSDFVLEMKMTTRMPMDLMKWRVLAQNQCRERWGDEDHESDEEQGTRGGGSHWTQWWVHQWSI